MYILLTVTTTTARWSAYFKTISKHSFFFFFEYIKESNENDVKIFELFLITEHFKSM